MTLSEISRQLDAARQDVALYRRLQGSEKLADALANAYEQAKAEEARADAEKAAADLEARMDGITNLTVVDASSVQAEGGLLHRTFEITYTKPTWCSFTATCPPKAHSVRGFAKLPEAAMLYLLNKAPEQIPAAILAFAETPGEAMGRYLVALRRGYM